MKKREYLDLLEDVLKQNSVSSDELYDILEDYQELYDGYLERGMTDAEVQEKLGSPYNVVASLKGSMRYERKPTSGGQKFIAISPFLALIAFFILGFGYDLWHPAWLVFLLIPVSAITLSMKENIWSIMTALSPFIALIFFMLYGYYTGVYHPTWLIFLIILFFSFLTMEEKRKYLYLALLVLASGAYLWIGATTGVYSLSLLVFVPLLVALIYYGHVEVTFIGDYRSPVGVVAILSIIVYFVGGYFFDLWGVLWLVFFAVPITAIILGEVGKKKYIAIAPFVSVTIFFLLGYFYDLWEFSWLAFLLVPMVAIFLGDE